jgi:hypothetical protein
MHHFFMSFRQKTPPKLFLAQDSWLDNRDSKLKMLLKFLHSCCLMPKYCLKSMISLDTPFRFNSCPTVDLSCAALLRLHQ